MISPEDSCRDWILYFNQKISRENIRTFCLGHENKNAHEQG